MVNHMSTPILEGIYPLHLFPYAPLFFSPPGIFGYVAFIHFLGPTSDKLDLQAKVWLSWFT